MNFLGIALTPFVARIVRNTKECRRRENGMDSKGGPSESRGGGGQGLGTRFKADASPHEGEGHKLNSKFIECGRVNEYSIISILSPNTL